MAILVCGGAGYIGSHAVHALAAAGQEVVVVDNLQTGHAAAVAGKAAFVQGDIRDAVCLDDIFRRFRIDGVMHFAADSQVGESMAKPLKYFSNNVGGMQSLLEAMVRHGVGRIVFSSSAAVYGEPDSVPVSEDAPTRPTNPYGHSKLMMEAMMRWVSAAHGIRYVSLRYFNVAGALADGSIGEDHSPESHLIPLVLQVPLGQRPHVTIFGEDYATPDGTCIRDYIAVTDLVDAHVKALDHLQRGGDDLICNLGNGQGFSVREIVEGDRSRDPRGHGAAARGRSGPSGGCCPQGAAGAGLAAPTGRGSHHRVGLALAPGTSARLRRAAVRLTVPAGTPAVRRPRCGGSAAKDGNGRNRHRFMQGRHGPPFFVPWPGLLFSGGTIILILIICIDRRCHVRLSLRATRLFLVHPAAGPGRFRDRCCGCGTFPPHLRPLTGESPHE